MPAHKPNFTPCIAAARAAIEDHTSSKQLSACQLHEEIFVVRTLPIHFRAPQWCSAHHANSVTVYQPSRDPRLGTTVRFRRTKKGLVIMLLDLDERVEEHHTFTDKPIAPEALLAIFARQPLTHEVWKTILDAAATEGTLPPGVKDDGEEDDGEKKSEEVLATA